MKGGDMEKILRQLYGDVVTEESLNLFKEELGKRFVPKSEFNQRGEELKQLRAQLAEQKAQVADAFGQEQKNKALREELCALKEAYEQEKISAKQREEEIRLQSALDQALTAEKARNLVAVKALLDMEGIKLEEGKLSGLAEQLDVLKQENAYLFDVQEEQQPFIRPGGNKTVFSQEDFEKMGYMERLRLKKEQPELYRKFTQNRGGKNLWQHI